MTDYGFSVSLRHELFLAIGSLFQDRSLIHRSWRHSMTEKAGLQLNNALKPIGGPSHFWIALPDVLPPEQSSFSFDAILQHLAKLPEEDLQKRLFTGLLHNEKAVKRILEDGVPFHKALARVPEQKREWYAYIALFPWSSESPVGIALEALLKTPALFRNSIIQSLEIFWKRGFKETWEGMLPDLSQSLEEKERLFHSASLSEFMELARIRVEVDERKRVLRAARGGYELQISSLQAVCFMPSAFNERRFWFAYKKDSSVAYAYFPYFDPSISPGPVVKQNRKSQTAADLDPAYILKALGDPTRFAMITLLAQKPRSSADLSRALSLSPPTVSHHIHLLRDAGVLELSGESGRAPLLINRKVLQSLSDLLIARLFSDKSQTKTEKK